MEDADASSFSLALACLSRRCPGAGLMNTVINYVSGKPSDPLGGYSYVHDSNLRQPRQIAATMHKMPLVTTVARS